MQIYRQAFSVLLSLLFASSAVSLSMAADAEQAIEPTEKIQLFNGKDFSNFYTFLKDYGVNKAPEGVFTVHDGMIHISGEGSGYVATEKPYKNYHFSAEFKWGKERSNKSKYVRNSGVLVHATGPDGGRGAWMSSLEVQLAQGCEGDFIVIGDRKKGSRSITVETKKGNDGRPRFSPGGEKLTSTGKQIWWNNHQEGFKELLDTRGANDVASPYGEWTKVEVIADGDTVEIKINGKTVNKATNVKPSAGKILLQNEKYEVFFRNVEIGPVQK